MCWLSMICMPLSCFNGDARWVDGWYFHSRVACNMHRFEYEDISR